MVETIGFKPPKSLTLVPEDTLASSDKEVELDIAAGNMPEKKKTPRKKNKRKPQRLVWSLSLFV